MIDKKHCISVSFFDKFVKTVAILINNNKIRNIMNIIKYKRKGYEKNMNILLDAMGGDNAPDANIKGAIKAITQIKADVTLIGKEEIIRAKVKEFTGKEIEEVSERLKIKNATETIEMEDQPTVAIKHKKDSSMVVGLRC